MNDVNQQTNAMQNASLVKPMLAGAVFALVLISIFVLPTTGKPEWGDYWKIKPLFITPLAGAAGGLFYYLLAPLRNAGGWKTVAGYVLFFIIFAICLWLGTVLGLNGTLWD